MTTIIWFREDLRTSAAGVGLGRDYLHPIVDQREGRKAALAAYSALTAG